MQEKIRKKLEVFGVLEANILHREMMKVPFNLISHLLLILNGAIEKNFFDIGIVLSLELEPKLAVGLFEQVVTVGILVVLFYVNILQKGVNFFEVLFDDFETKHIGNFLAFL